MKNVPEAGAMIVDKTLEDELVLLQSTVLLRLLLLIAHGTVAAHKDNLVILAVRLLNESFLLQLSLLLLPLLHKAAHL